MKAYGKSVTGLKRKNNEDAIYISDENSELKNLYIVADGMGGHNAGEVASNSAITAFNQYIHDNIHEIKEEEILDLLVSAVQYCNTDIYQKSSENESLSEMGTTLIAAVVMNHKLYVTHVGDSRLYVFKKEGEMRQLTNDHSYVMELVKLGKITREEAAVHPNRNIITRAVGTHATVEVDTIIENLFEGDIILICSDGLSTMVDDWGMKEILSKDENQEQKVQALIDKANEKGGLDNISIIMIEE